MKDQDNNTYSKKPDFVAYTVQQSRDGKGYWNRIGAAWEHRDGKGLEIDLASLPVNGRLTLREMREERMKGYEDERKESIEEPERHQDRSHDHDRAR
ncbi:MAG: hypothetical protein AB2799_17910 [Candidatus Thiodiazotropha sp.]